MSLETSQNGAEQARDGLEEKYEGLIWPLVSQWLSDSIDEAVGALSSITLVAAADPFAFTNVLDRWYGVVREIAKIDGPFADAEATRMLMESDMPRLVFDDVSEILRKSKDEGWTEYRTKRHLSKALIPKQQEGEERSKYRARVTQMARSGATRQFASLQLKEMYEQGYSRKQWRTVRDQRVRHTHAGLHGVIAPLDGYFNSGGYNLQYPGDPTAPPSETYNCFPAGSLVEGEAEGATRHWFEGELVEVETVGKKLTGTRNHPVLTDRGWVALGDLEEGSNLITYSAEVESSISHDVHASPTSIEQIFDSLEMAGDPVRVDRGRVDFHGERPQSDVDVVGVHRLLGPDDETPADEFLSQLPFPLSFPAAGLLPSKGSLNELPFGSSHAPDSRMSCFDVGRVLGGSSTSSHEAIGLGAASDLDPVLEQDTADRGTADPETFSDSVLGLSGTVAIEHVLKVRKVKFAGHVYNLSTRTGAYACNGIIVHNCRCVLVPYGAKRKPEPIEESPKPRVDRSIKDGRRRHKRRRRKNMAETITAAGEPGEVRLLDELRWEGTLGVEGVTTGDGRLIENGAVVWENLPHPLRYVRSDVGAHDGAEVVGLIEEIERLDDGKLWGRGRFLNTPTAIEAAERVADGSQRGISMDLDDVSFEYRMSEEAYNEAMESAEGAPSDPEVKDGMVVVHKGDSGESVDAILSARHRASTLVAIPAFIEAEIALVDEDQLDEVDPVDGDPAALVASAFRESKALPLEWFENPNLKEPTGLTVTKEGRVFGHLALWGTCHVSFSEACITPPESATNYAYFHTGMTETDKGELATGRITLGTGHAGGKLRANAAIAHYENTGTGVADVRVGEDHIGIWVAGAIRDLDENRLREFKSAPLSGDWREINGSLELVAALSVNVPGFPVPRAQGFISNQSQVSLIASGALPSAEPGDLEEADKVTVPVSVDMEKFGEVFLSALKQALKYGQPDFVLSSDVVDGEIEENPEPSVDEGLATIEQIKGLADKINSERFANLAAEIKAEKEN